jgi:predicted ATPase
VLSRFRVQGFKSLHDVEIDLAPLVVLIGPNASGKSNLLEALLLLSRLATEQTLSGAFEAPLRGYPLEAFSFSERGLEGLFEQQSADLVLEAEIEGLAYRVRVRIQPKTGGLSVVDESLARIGRSDLPTSDQVLDWVVVRLSPDGFDRTALSGERGVEELDRLRTELGAWRTYYLDPRDAMREPQPPRGVTDIGPRGEWIAPFLFRLKESEALHRDFEGIGRALRAAIPTIEGLDVDLDPRRGTLDIVLQQDGTRFTSRVVSEGTLRILALCCLAASPWPARLIAFEEPENGVHPRRVDVIADLLLGMTEEGRSQVVVTTHSPTFIAAMLQRQRELPDRIKLLRCSQYGLATEVREFLAAPLLDDPEIRSALIGPEDPEIVEAMMVRGWLDG